MTAKTNDLKTERTPIGEIKPYEKNAKKHSDQQIAILSGLIKRHGWTQPIIVDVDGVIIAGHGRRLAAIKLGLTHVPTIWRRDLTKQEAAALRLADNRVVSTDFDTMLEQEELLALDAASFDISGLGFADSELEFLTKDLAEMDDQIFVDDVSKAVSDQKDANASDADDADKSAAPVGDAFGFKRVTLEQSRTIRTFMSSLEENLGLKGADALMKHIEECNAG